jgi:hypothetical protein
MMNHSSEDVMIPVRCWLSPFGLVLHEDELRTAKATLLGRDFVDLLGDPLAYERKRIAALNSHLGFGAGKKKPQRSGKKRGVQKSEGGLRESVSKCLEKSQKV